MGKRMIKEELVNHCINLLEAKLTTIDGELNALQKASNEETKSSAGDKYETGRAMMMLEKEKLMQQKEQINMQVKALRMLDWKRQSSIVEAGALLAVSGVNYFVVTSIGKVTIANESYFVLSPVAPIVQQMLGKKAGESFDFNGRHMEIQQIY